MTKLAKSVNRVQALRRHVAAWRAKGETVALVPTMGALHAGHLALVRTAKKSADRVVVSIFVNPTQFAPNEDFSRYPRDPRADRALLGAEQADLVFLPDEAEMYPEGFTTSILLAGPAGAGLEDIPRPHHFSGVATVVCKLLSQCGPDIAIFGEKDYQQLQVIRQMVRDLDLPVKILGGRTVREKDGLALSSRNAYLSEAERAVAPALNRALKDAAAQITAGTSPARAASGARKKLTQAGFRVDYVEARNANSLEPVGNARTEPVRLLAAAWLGKTRLIDNIPVQRPA